jgi:hypothetical protein
MARISQADRREIGDRDTHNGKRSQAAQIGVPRRRLAGKLSPAGCWSSALPELTASVR